MADEVTHVIWKYALPIDDSTVIYAPAPAIVRHVGKDPGGAMCAWIEVNPDRETIERTFVIRGTGHPFNPTSPMEGLMRPQSNFFATVNDGPFMWHVFVETP